MVESEEPDVTESSDIPESATGLVQTKRTTGDLNNSLHEVRNHLRNVINMMGPKIELNPSSDADNEESIFSSASLISSVVKMKIIKPEQPRKSTHYEQLKNCATDRCHCVNCAYQEYPQTPLDKIKSGPKKMVEWLSNKTDPDLYRVEMKNAQEPPKRFVFDLVEEESRNKDRMKDGRNFDCIPRKSLYRVSENIKEISGYCKGCEFVKNGKQQRKRGEPIDVYYFDHGNYEYYRTTDACPQSAADALCEKTEELTTKFWSDFFGTINIGCAFIMAFILQFIKFLLYSLVRPLTIGVIQLVSDYFFKPCLAVSFNGCFQPFLIFCYNLATSIRDLLEPIAEGFGFFMEKFANLFRVCRLIEIHREYSGKRFGEHTV